jgi:hypothetical protein
MTSHAEAMGNEEIMILLVPWQWCFLDALVHASALLVPAMQ